MNAQEGRVVSNIEVLDLDNTPTKLPFWGEKSLLIFYVDPDRAGQNDDFIRELRDKPELKSDNVFGFSIINLKDAPMIPNGLANRMARKRSESQETPFFTDDRSIVATKWNLGDCDNFSTIILIDTKGEILFVSKGKITEKNKIRFYQIYNEIK